MRGLTFAIPVAWAFPPINGAVFADAAWIKYEELTERAGSVGAGFFLGGGYYPAIRWNFVWPTRDFTTYPKQPRTQFSIGYNF
jgi:hypothetical protein